MTDDISNLVSDLDSDFNVVQSKVADIKDKCMKLREFINKSKDTIKTAEVEGGKRDAVREAKETISSVFSRIAEIEGLSLTADSVNQQIGRTIQKLGQVK